MVELKQDTEKKILKAAKQVFTHKGMGAARMQEIADTAGINKSLLHYYYRTKERLFEAVLKDAINSFYPTITQTMMSADIDLEQKIKTFVSGFHKMLLENPYVPSFIIMEVNRDPEKVLSLFNDFINVVQNFALPSLNEQIIGQVSEGKIQNIDVRNLMLNIVSLCIFPFVGRPLVKIILFENNDSAYDDFIKDRSEKITKFIINAISIS